MEKIEHRPTRRRDEKKAIQEAERNLPVVESWDEILGKENGEKFKVRRRFRIEAYSMEGDNVDKTQRLKQVTPGTYRITHRGLGAILRRKKKGRKGQNEIGAGEIVVITSNEDRLHRTVSFGHIISEN